MENGQAMSPSPSIHFYFSSIYEALRPDIRTAGLTLSLSILVMYCNARDQRVLGRTHRYGDAHASHSSLPHLEASDLECLMSRLAPDTILLALSCLLQVYLALLRPPTRTKSAIPHWCVSIFLRSTRVT